MPKDAWASSVPNSQRSYLVIAYRHLSGNPPSAAERAGLAGLIDHRLHANPSATSDAATWEAERATIRGETPRSAPSMERRFGPYSWFTNCTADAFATAVKTLRGRVATFGASSPAVKSWLDAQETVFANCSDGEAIPKPAEDDLPAVIRADRAYQIAAAHFYAMGTTRGDRS